MARLARIGSFDRRDVLLGCGSVVLASAIGRTASAQAVGFGDVAVIFVGASWCPYCKRAAPVLAAIMEPAGIPVLVASHDGRPILPFAQVEDARTHPIASSILRLPTTLIYSGSADAVVAHIEGYGTARRYAARVSSAVRQVADLSPEILRQMLERGTL